MLDNVTLGTAFTWAILLLTFVLLTSLVRNKYSYGLSGIPGPAIAAYSGLWRVYNVSTGHAHETAINLHKKYGKLVRIAPHVVSIGDADEIAKIYSIKGDYTKTGFYPLQSIYWKKKVQLNLFSTRSEKYHREQRRKVANAFTLESLLKMEDAVDDCGRLFLERMRRYADNAQEVDLGEWLQFYTFDVVGEWTFGSKLGFLETGTDVDGMMAAIEGMLVYAANCGQIPEAHRWLLGNPVLTAVMPAMENWNQVVMFTLKAINARTKISKGGELELQDGSAGNDMLSNWAAVKSRAPEKMNTAEIVTHLSTNVFAGSDTTAIALRAIFYFLMKNPDKMRKLREEVDEARNSNTITNPVQDEQARKLPYLNAAIKEGMRLHPSVGLIFERHVPSGGAVICGKHLLEGTIVGINPWVLQHDPEVFPDPESFQPERWLESRTSKDQLAAMEKHFFSFGAGSRSCIGRNMSMIEMRKIIPQLVLEFDMSIEGGKEWSVKNVWFTQQRMPPVILKRRQN